MCVINRSGSATSVTRTVEFVQLVKQFLLEPPPHSCHLQPYHANKICQGNCLEKSTAGSCCIVVVDWHQNVFRRIYASVRLSIEFVENSVAGGENCSLCGRFKMFKSN